MYMPVMGYSSVVPAVIILQLLKTWSVGTQMNFHLFNIFCRYSMETVPSTHQIRIDHWSPICTISMLSTFSLHSLGGKLQRPINLQITRSMGRGMKLEHHLVPERTCKLHTDWTRGLWHCEALTVPLPETPVWSRFIDFCCMKISNHISYISTQKILCWL